MQTDIVTQTLITYEQPLNENMRLYLRLENLFQQLKESIAVPQTANSKNGLRVLLQIVNITDRPDIKSKITKILTHQTKILTPLLGAPDVNHARLRDTLDQFDTIMTALHHNHSRIGDHARRNEFLSQIRIQLSHPGGICSNHCPPHALWLSTPTKERIKDLQEWAKEFQTLETAVRLILKVLRDSTPSEKLQCQDGLYQKALDRHVNCEMIRIQIPTHYSIYPECSASKHRVVIRFLHPNYYGGGRSEQTHKHFNFHLACCRL